MKSELSKNNIFNKSGKIIERYTAPLVCSVILTFILILDELGIFPLEHDFEDDLKIAFSTAFLASGALGLHLNAKHRINLPVKLGLTGLIAVLVITAGLLSSWFQQSPLFLYPGLGLLIMAAPFLLRQSNENSVWLYNSRFGTAIVMSIIASVLFGGGLYAISSSLDFLLGIDVHRNVYDIIWIIAIAFVGPIFGLYLMPTDSNEELVLPDNAALLARGVTFLINYVLTPMLVIYLAILHLYAAKILLTLSLPKGQVALMVLIFSLGLTGFILFARPWASRSTLFTNWLLKYWHLLLFTPLVLLSISVTRRVSDYGVTPERYMLVVLGLWLFALFLLPILKRTQLSNVRIISSLATILIIASFGPWGAKSISISSQKHEFIKLLQRNDLLQDGKLKTDLVEVPQFTAEHSKTSHSIVRFLSRNNGLESLKPLFEGHPKNPFETIDNTRNKWDTNNRITKLLGFSYNGKHNSDHLNYTASKPTSINISSYNTYIPRLRLQNHTKRSSAELTVNETHVWREDDKIFIETAGSIFTAKIDSLIALTKKQIKQPTHN